MHFGENQLSPSLIGLSPLPTGHPPGFQPWWVRASTRSYPRFTLPMGRSLGFGSIARDWIALFRLGFPTATDLSLTSPRTVTRRLILQKARRQTYNGPKPEVRLLRLFVGARFQVLFHSPPGVLFTFPSRYWFTIGRWEVVSLTRWASQIRAGFLGPRTTWEHHRKTNRFLPTRLLRSLARLSRRFG